MQLSHEVLRSYKNPARADGAKCLAGGAVTFVQRFGSLSLNVHLHVVVADGLFVRNAPTERPTFQPSAAPDHETMSHVSERLAQRIARMLRRKKVTVNLPVEERSNEYPDTDALDGCAEIASRSRTHASIDATVVRASGSMGGRISRVDLSIRACTPRNHFQTASSLTRIRETRRRCSRR